MRNPPKDPTPETLAAALTRQWGVVAALIGYRAVGFGSHHWTVLDPAGGGWFLTVDDLDIRRLSAVDSRDAAGDRLGAALDTALALHEAGAEFVVAPVPTAGGATTVRLDDRHAASLFPQVHGESFGYGAFTDENHRRAVLDMVIRVHTAPAAVRSRALADDLGIPHRDALEAALDGAPAGVDGPYAELAAGLITDHAEALRARLDHYDTLVDGVDRGRFVLTHGEPHPGNTMRTADGWRLIDWDTVRLAPPERDLCLLDGEWDAYAAATGVRARPELLELFRLRWALADVAIEADRFRRDHAGDANDDHAWSILRSTVNDLTG